MIGEIPPVHWPNVQKVLPAVYGDELSYYELLAKMEKVVNDLIAQANAVGIEVNQFEEALKNIENLDEIDEQVQALQETANAIEEFLALVLTNYVVSFPTVNDMKQYDGEVYANCIFMTQGYNVVNDGGGGKYALTAETPNDIDIIAVGNYAVKLISDGVVNVKQYGATGFSAAKDTSGVLRANTVAKENSATLYFPSGDYELTDSVPLATETDIRGDGWDTHISSTAQTAFVADTPNLRDINFSNMRIDGNSIVANVSGEISCSHFTNIYFDSLGGDIVSAYQAIEVVNFTDCWFRRGNRSVYSRTFMYCVSFNHCWFNATNETYVYSNTNTELVSFNACEFQAQTNTEDYDNFPALFFRWARAVSFSKCYFENCHKLLVKNDIQTGSYTTTPISFTDCHFTRSRTSLGYDIFTIDSPTYTIFDNCDTGAAFTFTKKGALMLNQPVKQAQNNRTNPLSNQGFAEKNIITTRKIKGVSDVINFCGTTITGATLIEFARYNGGDSNRKHTAFISGTITVSYVVVNTNGINRRKIVQTPIMLTSIARTAFALAKGTDVVLLDEGTITIPSVELSLSASAVAPTLMYSIESFGNGNTNECAYATIEYDLTLSVPTENGLYAIGEKIL